MLSFQRNDYDVCNLDLRELTKGVANMAKER